MEGFEFVHDTIFCYNHNTYSLTCCHYRLGAFEGKDFVTARTFQRPTFKTV